MVLLGDPIATFARKVICELGELLLVFDELVAFMSLLVPLAWNNIGIGESNLCMTIQDEQKNFY